MEARVMENVRVFLWAGGPMACSCQRVPVRHGLLSCLRPESGSAWGCCSEVKGIMVYELIGKKRRQINNEVDWILTALMLCSSLRGLERWYWDSLLNKAIFSAKLNVEESGSSDWSCPIASLAALISSLASIFWCADACKLKKQNWKWALKMLLQSFKILTWEKQKNLHMKHNSQCNVAA